MWIHADMWWRLGASGLVSLGAGLFGLIGLLSPQTLGWPSPVPWQGKLAMLVLVGLLPLWLLSWWGHYRALWVYRHVDPVTRWVQIQTVEDSESRSYYAQIQSADGNATIWTLPVYRPQGTLPSPGVNHLGAVYLEPKSGKPLVITIDGQRFWAVHP